MIESLNGEYVETGEWAGRPLYTGTDGVDRALYWYDARGKWIFATGYSTLSAEQKMRGAGVAAKASPDGKVPEGVQEWNCNLGPGNWQKGQISVWFLLPAATQLQQSLTEETARREHVEQLNAQLHMRLEGVPPPAAEPEPEQATHTGRDDDAGYRIAAGDEDEGRPAATPTLPLAGDVFPDQVLAIVCRFLGPRELGRLACVSRRFTERTLTKLGAAHGEHSGRLSVIEEGARLRLVAASPGGDATVVWYRQATWLRALWYAECGLFFKSCGPDVELSDEGTWS